MLKIFKWRYTCTVLSLTLSLLILFLTPLASIAKRSKGGTTPPPPTQTTSYRFVSPSAFGMHYSSAMYQPWPSASFAVLRTWDQWPGVGWASLNPSKGTYDWQNLDAVVNAASAHGVEIVYTFGYTPSFASTNPTGACASSSAGSCYAPNTADWQEFVSQITTRYKGKIKYWELWNEPNTTNFWQGTYAQQVTMAKTAYSIIKNSGGTVLSPAPQGPNSYQWLDGFFAAGGAPYVDVVDFHGYNYGAPEFITTLYTNLRNVQAKYGISSKPLWDTEHSWGSQTWPFGTSSDLQSAWLSRFIALSMSSGIDRSFWYMWDGYDGKEQWGMLFNANSKQITPPGAAYNQVYNWLANANIGACTQSGNIYQCPITRTGTTYCTQTNGITSCQTISGYQALMVWNTSGNSSFTPPAGFTRYRTLDGATVPISTGASATIGIKPILFENL